jgi:exodeoxyribonuclease VII large subunit
VLSEPSAQLRQHIDDVTTLRERGRRCLATALTRAEDDLVHVRARVLSLSPASTLQRGYAVVQRSDDRVVRSATEVGPGDPLRIRLADGELAASVSSDGQP